MACTPPQLGGGGGLRRVKNVRKVFAGGGVKHFYFRGGGYIVKGG